MVGLLFRRGVQRDARVLDAGCGDGAFIDGILRWCATHSVCPPQIVGIELDLALAQSARSRFCGFPNVQILEGDFLAKDPGVFDFVVGNPPYVPITSLSPSERSIYRHSFETARGRFDLFLLFFEQALRSLEHNGRLVFITPEKFLYTATAAPLRRILSRRHIEEIRLVDEATFEGFVTYPTITTVIQTSRCAPTELIDRMSRSRKTMLPADGRSWQPLFHDEKRWGSNAKLEDVADRISCGVATGADAVFVLRTEQVDESLKRFAHPTLAGRELDPGGMNYELTHSMLVPYAMDGGLLPETMLGGLGAYLRDPVRRAQLLKRTCVERKPWYAFHDNAPLAEILRPKILCKDIAARPYFWLDFAGEVLPRHSVYYIVPKRLADAEALRDFLNSRQSCDWLAAHCQRAANGFLRLQSHVLKQLPVPRKFARGLTRNGRSRRGVPSAQLAFPVGTPNVHAV